MGGGGGRYVVVIGLNWTFCCRTIREDRERAARSKAKREKRQATQEELRIGNYDTGLSAREEKPDLKHLPQGWKNVSFWTLRGR